MYLIHCKSKNFPTKITVDLNDLDMARGFQKEMPGRFAFIVNRVKDPTLFAGLNYFVMNGPRRLRSLYIFFWWPWWFWRFKRHHRHEREFWVWLNEPALLAIVAFWSKLLPCRILLEFIGSFSHQVERPLYRFARSCNDIWSAALSETARQLLLTFDRRYEKKSFVLRTGYNPDSLHQVFEPQRVRAELNLRPENFVVGYSGHFETNGPKGVELMIEALTHLPDRRIKMYLIGGYPAEIEHFSGLADKLGVKERVVFVPWQRDLKLAMAYANAADVMAIPTSQANQHNQYSFPVKIWEYLALGKPIISSDLPINREVLNTTNARFFDLGDARAFAKQVQYLHENPQLQAELSRNSKQAAIGFTWPERAKQVVEFITVQS